MVFRMRMLLNALIILFVASCAVLVAETAAFGISQPLLLRQIDELIKSTEYDKALLELNDYLEAHPESFDAVQKRISRIMKVRDVYTMLANELLETIREEPDNTEKLGALSRKLLSIERNPDDRRLDIIKDTDDVSALARYSRYQRKSAELTGEGRFVEGAKSAAAGFFLYRNDFETAYAGTERLAEVEQRLGDVNAMLTQYEQLQRKLENAKNAYIAAVSGSVPASANVALETVKSVFGEFAELRNRLLETAGFFGSGDEESSESKETDYGDLFCRYARSAIVGRKNEKGGGIAGAMDTQWRTYVEEMKSASADSIQKLSANFASRLSSENISAALNSQNKTLLSDIQTVTDYALSVNGLYAMLKENGVGAEWPLPENYALSMRYVGSEAQFTAGALEYPIAAVSFQQQSDFIEFESDASDEELAGKNLAAPLFEAAAGVAKLMQKPSDAAAENGAWRTEYDAARKRAASARPAEEASPEDAAAQTSVRRGKAESAKRAARRASQAAKTKAQLTINDDIIAWKDMDTAAETVIDSFTAYVQKVRSSIIKKAADFYVACGIAYVDSAEKLKEEARAALPSQSGKSNAEDAPKKYPQKTLDALALLDDHIAHAKPVLENALKNVYAAGLLQNSSEAVSIRDSMNKLSGMTALSASLSANASSLLRSAQRAKNEAESRLSQAERALHASEFTTARKRLEEAGEKFVESLSYNEDAELRASSDARIASLGEEIKLQENVDVVREVRTLKNAARREYFNGNFESAQKFLTQAAARWAVTNVDEDTEIADLTAMVETALSMKTGRIMFPSDSLYPEMSQILSIAHQYYNSGADLFKRGNRTEGNAKLAASLQKLDELRIVYPLNQDANLLTLRIQQLRDPAEFNRRFAQRVTTAKDALKNPDTRRSTYTDLLDLYAIDPSYPGLKQLIYDVEIEIGIRAKPVKRTEVDRSGELVVQARSLFKSAGRGDTDTLRRAMAIIDRAIQMNAENGDALLLKDEISMRLGGNATVVLSSKDLELYNRAVQALNENNILAANDMVETLLRTSGNRNSSRILELQRRIKARN